MNCLILILSVVPIYATGDVFGDLLGQEYVTIEHVRERRQVHGHGQQLNYRPISQAPPQIQHLLQAQQARDPIVHLPPQPPPNLTPVHRGEPQYQNQAQVSQYQPKVQYGPAPQQPTYKSIPVTASPYRRPTAPQQPAYQSAGGNYPQSAPQSNYRPVPISAPQVGPKPQYSNKLPPQLQQLLHAQANLPNSIPQG